MLAKKSWRNSEYSSCQKAVNFLSLSDIGMTARTFFMYTIVHGVHTEDEKTEYQLLENKESTK